MYITAMTMLPIGCATNEPIQIQNVLCTLLCFTPNEGMGLTVHNVLSILLTEMAYFDIQTLLFTCKLFVLIKFYKCQNRFQKRSATLEILVKI